MVYHDSLGKKPFDSISTQWSSLKFIMLTSRCGAASAVGTAIAVIRFLSTHLMLSQKKGSIWHQVVSVHTSMPVDTSEDEVKLP